MRYFGVSVKLNLTSPVSFPAQRWCACHIVGRLPAALNSFIRRQTHFRVPDKGPFIIFPRSFGNPK
jgi:hypothetical protein